MFTIRGLRKEFFIQADTGGRRRRTAVTVTMIHSIRSRRMNSGGVNEAKLAAKLGEFNTDRTGSAWWFRTRSAASSPNGLISSHRKEKALGEKKDSDTGRATGVDSKPTELRPVVLREAATHSREDHRGGKGQKAFHVGAC